MKGSAYVHEIIESSFVDRIMMIWQQPEQNFVFEYIHTYVQLCCKCQYQQKNSIHPIMLNVVSKDRGSKSLATVIGLKLPYYGMFHFQFVNSSFTLSSVWYFLKIRDFLLCSYSFSFHTSIFWHINNIFSI